jgi:hypothetical protein
MEMNVNRVKVVEHGAKGVIWFIGWLFTIGFLQLSFGQGILAIIIWPYYLGNFIRSLIH